MNYLNKQPNNIIIDLICHLCGNNEIWVPFADFSFFEYYLSSKRKINLNFNIDNYYILWHYTINNTEVLINSYETLKDKERKTINELSTKSKKAIVKAASTLVLCNNSFSKNDLIFLLECDFSNLLLHRNKEPDKELILFQNLDNLIDPEIELLIGSNCKKIVMTTKEKNLLYFDGFSAVKVDDKYLLWDS